MSRSERRRQEKLAKKKRGNVQAAQAADTGAARMAFMQKALHEAVQHMSAGNLAQTQAICEKILSIDNAQPDALNLLGLIAIRTQQYEKAVPLIQKALSVFKRNADAHNNLGVALNNLGRRDEALKCFENAISLNPQHADAHTNIGNVLAARKTWGQAIAHYEKSLQIAPKYARSHYNIAIAYEQTGALDKAQFHYEQAIANNPKDSNAYNNLGALLLDNNKIVEAIESYKKSISADPSNANAYKNLATAYSKTGDVEKNIECCRKALEINPRYANAYSLLGDAYMNLCDPARSLENHKQALLLDDSKPVSYFNCLFSMHHFPNIRPQDFRDLYTQLSRVCSPAPKVSDVFPDLSAHKETLTIGLYGKGRIMCQHPAMWFAIATLENLASDTVKFFVYTDGQPKEDAFSDRLKSISEPWVSITNKEDADVANRIREDQIDILISMSGPTESRLSVFSHRPAPVQVLWGAHWGSTGLKSVDWIVADEIEVPLGHENEYTESVYRMPDGYIVYTPPEDAPAVAPLPAADNGFVTFGCFNRSSKLNPELIMSWAGVLEAIPNSKLLLKGLGYLDVDGHARFTELFQDNGIAPDRLIFEGPTSHHELLESYNRVDIALDTAPYSGGLTTCEALWMGVPVLTRPGQLFSGRHSASHLNNVGLIDWIASSQDDFVAKAKWWSEHINDLAELRRTLRETMRRSPLCDASRYAKNFEHALREMWEQACENAAH